MLDTIKQIVVRYVSQLFLLVTLAGLGYFAYQTYMNNRDLERRYQDLVGKEEEFKRLSDYVASLERRYEDEKALHARLEKEWANEKEALKGRIKILSDSTFSSKNNPSKLAGADYLDPNGEWSIFEAKFIKGEAVGPPVCWFQVYKDGKGRTKVYDHKIRVNLAISRDESDGRYTILTKAAYILDEQDVDEKYKAKTGWKGEPYPLDVTGGSASIDPTESQAEPRFFWWTPHLNGGINLGVESGGFFARPALGISWMGYGKTTRDLKWKFLQTGFSFEPDLKFFDVHLMPFLYRPFDSFITNTYIGPGISTGSRGTGYFLGVSLGF